MIEEKCIQLELAELQRTKEVRAGLGLDGTMGYEEMGCYDCDVLVGEE